MNLSCPRRRALRRAALFTATAAVVLAGCGSVDGLGPGEPAPSVSVQPRPEPLWPAWSGTSSEAPGADTATHQPPPEALEGLPKLGKDGLRTEDFRKVLRADPRMKPLAERGEIDRPGEAGIRPPLLTDLTGDGRPELLVAADTESGRSVLAVYKERDGRVYPILFTAGKRVSIETLGQDVLVRSSCADGGQQAVRYHWDGVRMSTVSDNKSYKKTSDSDGSQPTKPAPDLPGRIKPSGGMESSRGAEPSGGTEPSDGRGGQ
ncbi:hypothetical protein ACFWPU_26515 [Streptomyces sp. NPDC058471]|uniref:hypothetical protein n=1 Tax=Streptomyces sp. NPDC058471 TaxID=3346516 RepID=UPI0036663C25